MIETIGIPLGYSYINGQIYKTVDNEKIVNVESEETKMVYNAEKAKKIEEVKAGEVNEGTILEIVDGTVRGFVPKDFHATWKGNLDSPAIEIHGETKWKEQTFKFNKMFTYSNDSEKNVLFGLKSNLGKFVARYGNLPKKNMKVKCISNADGFWDLMM